MDQKLLDILGCPLCKAKLIYKRDRQQLICKLDKLAFSIQAGIPILLVESATYLSEEEMEDVL